MEQPLRPLAIGFAECFDLNCFVSSSATPSTMEPTLHYIALDAMDQNNYRVPCVCDAMGIKKLAELNEKIETLSPTDGLEALQETMRDHVKLILVVKGIHADITEQKKSLDVALQVALQQKQKIESLEVALKQQQGKLEAMLSGWTT